MSKGILLHFYFTTVSSSLGLKTSLPSLKFSTFSINFFFTIKVQALICSLENINIVVLRLFHQQFGCMSCIIVSVEGPLSPKTKFFCRLSDVFIPDLPLLFFLHNIFHLNKCTSCTGRQTTLSHNAPTTILDLWDSRIWIECLAFCCQMKTTY